MADHPEREAKKTQVFLIDESMEMRDSLRKLLEAEPDFSVCGEAGSMDEALKTIAAALPDMAIVDVELCLQSGLNGLRALPTKGQQLLILVLSMHAKTLYEGSTFRLGAHGYLMKSDPPDKILLTLRQILRGKGHEKSDG